MVSVWYYCGSDWEPNVTLGPFGFEYCSSWELNMTLGPFGCGFGARMSLNVTLGPFGLIFYGFRANRDPHGLVVVSFGSNG